jgi:hypothetical protein
VRWRGGHGVNGKEQVIMGEGKLPFHGDSEAALTAGDGSGNEKASPIFPDIWEERFELTADAGEVGVG